ncbi:hypothetical protein T440DRAFT_521673 [Plenodomus tracheiphilus IPT5]|uniref:MFS general substrate transporter n=1 Tax=Plenodomus tracheiphilus IPT5 TaxID=1408161 RepID=A0A6A7AT50_9PLEO|nr:hypothetical protein T440DRAFT_521673 [Plenodomus tracheiphilus IPT5]
MAHRKVDKRLLCWYAFVYLIMRIHVSNISNTAIMDLEQGAGIKKQLGNLSSAQWALALSIFYYPYMFFEPLADEQTSAAVVVILTTRTRRRHYARIMPIFLVAEWRARSTHSFCFLVNFSNAELKE